MRGAARGVRPRLRKVDGKLTDDRLEELSAALCGHIERVHEP
jgi:hypothetical protein